MQDAAYEQLVERLTAGEPLDKVAEDCLLAAADGTGAVAALLAGSAVPQRDIIPPPAVDPVSVYLDRSPSPDSAGSPIAPGSSCSPVRA